MAIKKIRVHGNVRWRARVAYQGKQKVAYCQTREAAKAAEVAFYAAIRQEAAQAERAGQQPATLRALLALYANHLEFRRKPSDTVGRARDTAKTIGRVLPELLDRPVSAIGDAEVLAFVKAREREGKAEVIGGKRTTDACRSHRAAPIAI